MSYDDDLDRRMEDHFFGDLAYDDYKGHADYLGDLEELQDEVTC